MSVQCLIPDPSSDPDGFILGTNWIHSNDFQHFCIRFLSDLKSARSDLLLTSKVPWDNSPKKEARKTKKKKTQHSDGGV